MDCKRCGKPAGKNGKDPRTNQQKYKCNHCGYNFREDSPVVQSKPTIGMPLEKWQEKYDVDFIVENVMKSLDKSVMYEKADLYKLSGLTPSYPGLSAAIDSYTNHYGKAGGKQFFSHPDTIQHYKQKGRLT